MPKNYKTVREDDGLSGEILHRHFLSEFRDSYILYGEEEYFLAGCYLKHADDLEDFQVYDDDVWVVSFPKTGTTWTQEMVWMIGNDLDVEGAKTYLNERFPNPGLAAQYDFECISKKYPKLSEQYGINSVNFSSKVSRPRYLKSHAPWELLPKQIRNGEVRPKIIYVTRNPKDACVSYFYHSKVFGKFSGTFEQFCDLFLDDKVLWAPYWKHVKEFWDRKDDTNILFITYEEMINNFPDVLKKVGSFLGKDLSEKDIKFLENHLSFESMKKNPAVNNSYVYSAFKNEGFIQKTGEHIRSGKVGAYKVQMSQEYADKFEKWTEENAKKIGFSFT